MRGRFLFGVLGVAIGVLTTLALAYALKSRPTAEASEGVPFDGSSCANAEPLQLRFLFNCDVIGDRAGGMCNHAKDLRSVKRDNVRLGIQGVRDSWSSTLRTMKIVQRFESGDLVYTADIGERTLKAIGRALHIDAEVARPQSKRAFLMLLECGPYTWSSVLLSSIRLMTDVDLDETERKLPEILAVKPSLESELSFLSANATATSE